MLIKGVAYVTEESSAGCSAGADLCVREHCRQRIRLAFAFVVIPQGASVVAPHFKRSQASVALLQLSRPFLGIFQGVVRE